MNKKQQEEINLEAKNFFNLYKKEMGESIRTGRVVIISFDSLKALEEKLSEKILENPEETISLMETALGEMGFVENPRIKRAFDTRIFFPPCPL